MPKNRKRVSTGETGHIPNLFHEALRRDLDAARANDLADNDSVSIAFEHSPDSGWLYRVLRGELHLKPKDLPTWYRATGGGHWLEWLAARCDRIVLAKPTGQTTRAAGEVLREVGEFITELADADQDDLIEPAELSRIEREGAEAILAIEAAIEAARYRCHTRRVVRLSDTQGKEAG